MLTMKTAEEIRRLRLMMLLEEAGSGAELNRRTGKIARDSTYNQILNRSLGSRTKKPKEMGPDLARSLETTLGKPRGWMDLDPELEAKSWPFRDVNEQKLRNLSDRQLAMLESALLLAAAQLGFDIAAVRQKQPIACVDDKAA